MKIKLLLSVVLISVLPFSTCLYAEELDKEISDLTAQVVSAVDQADVKTIATLDFVDLQGNTSQLGRFVADEISADLVMAKKRFTVVDRANLKKIMQENKLTVSGLVDPENAKKLGQIAGVDAIVTGTITPFEKTIRVVIKVIATDTAKIIAAARGQITKSSSVEKLAGGGVTSDTDTESSDLKEQSTTDESPKHGQNINLGDVIASVEWARLSRDNKLEVSLTFTNKTKHVLWITPGSNDLNRGAQATDDLKNRYQWKDAVGFRRNSEEVWPRYTKPNKFLQLEPQIPAPVSFIFLRISDDGPDTKSPTKIRFFAELTIVDDMKAQLFHNRSVSATIRLD
jgi:TolB-like protein